MAGIGFDALMIRDADRELKDRVGRAAYIWTGAHHIREDPVDMRVVVDGTTWFHGDAACVLVANVGTIIGGITAFESARPDDGRLEVGVVTASGMVQWSRVMARMITGRPDKTPLIQMTSGTKIDVRLAREATLRAGRWRPPVHAPPEDPGPTRGPPRVHADRHPALTGPSAEHWLGDATSSPQRLVIVVVLRPSVGRPAASGDALDGDDGDVVRRRRRRPRGRPRWRR